MDSLLVRFMKNVIRKEKRSQSYGMKTMDRRTSLEDILPSPGCRVWDRIGAITSLDHSYNYDEDAFLFTLKNPFDMEPMKLSCLCPSKATFNHPSYGPLFGFGNDIAISSECNKEKGGWINCPGTKGYENPTGKGSSLFVNPGGPLEGNFFRVDEIEVYGL